MATTTVKEKAPRKPRTAKIKTHEDSLKNDIANAQRDLRLAQDNLQLAEKNLKDYLNNKTVVDSLMKVLGGGSGSPRG